jgi:hypothetical protein
MSFSMHFHERNLVPVASLVLRTRPSGTPLSFARAADGKGLPKSMIVLLFCVRRRVLACSPYSPVNYDSSGASTSNEY